MMHIYKFCSFEIAKIIVSSRLLKFNNPTTFNDPFDCDINLLEFNFTECNEEIENDIEATKKLIKSQHKSDISMNIDEVLTKKNIEEIYKNSQMNKVKKNSICCFSMNHDNLIMWSHYADKHKGVCLVFDLEIKQPIEDGVLWKRMNMGPVFYTDLEPVNYLKSKHSGIENLFYNKSKDWSYEEEWRMFILDDSIEFVKFKPDFLKGVIFGVNVSDGEIFRFKQLFNHLDYKKVHFGRMIKDNLQMSSIDIT